MSVVSFDSLASKLTQVMLLRTEKKRKMFCTTMGRKDVRICQIRIFQPMGRKVRMVGLGKMRCALRSRVVRGRFGDKDEIVFIIFHLGF